MKNKYIFKSERLGFRNWIEEDLIVLAKINADIDIMKHFPKTQTKNETSEFKRQSHEYIYEEGRG